MGSDLLAELAMKYGHYRMYNAKPPGPEPITAPRIKAPMNLAGGVLW